MNRRELIEYLRQNGCRLVCQGRRHEFWEHATTGRHSVVPRHREVRKGTCRGICDDLGIPKPPGL